mmetsp:Transcript_100/g.231  ORF Transcript_100/g.231 Transcript_100/m.231 type:complete len:410 (-) Transcript_100:67-1296(-)
MRQVLRSPKVAAVAFEAPPPQYASGPALAGALDGPPAFGPEAATTGTGVVRLQWAPLAAGLPAAVFIKWSTVEGIRRQYVAHHDAAASEKKIAARVAAHASETVVYGTVAPTLRARGVRLPRAHAVECVPGDHFALFLELKPGYSVRPALDPAAFTSAVRALAAFHGACFGDAELMAHFEQQGCFWTAEKQDEPGPTQLGDAWIAFAARFAAVGGGVGGRVATTAPSLDRVHRAVSAHFGEGRLARQTLCHGDFKSANLLWPTASADSVEGDDRVGVPADGEPVLIDFEWAGPGAAAQDLAYLLLSSCPVRVNWAEMVAAYHTQLPAGVREHYAAAELQSDVELATLEVFRWLLCGRWKAITPAEMEADFASYGRVLPNRSIPHAVALCRRVVDILETNAFVQQVLASP